MTLKVEGKMALKGKGYHSDSIKAFTVSNESYWYKKGVNSPDPDLLFQIFIGFYDEDPEGGTTGEFSVSWATHHPSSPKLEIFGDGASALSQMPEILDYMASNEDATPEEFKDWLIRFGYVDQTKRDNRRGKR